MKTCIYGKVKICLFMHRYKYINPAINNIDAIK